ncbi:MAG: hypothetical protein JWN51_2891, partial [Phycisphaerales bacterium]|nr:hypothetical protein [Phycisphaerales bacterium]
SAGAGPGHGRMLLHHNAHLRAVAGEALMHATLLTAHGARGAAMAATVDWGDGTAADPSAIRFQSMNGGLRLVGGHTYLKAGAFDVTITVSQGGSMIGSMKEIVQVAAKTPNGRTISTTTMQSFNAVLGSAVHGLSSAVGLSIDWGDGSISAPTVSSHGGRSVLSGSHVYAQAGRYAVVVTRAGVGGARRAPAYVLVADAMVNAPGGLTLAATTGTRFNGNLGTLTSSLTPVEVGIEWGDGTHSPGTFVSLGNNQYQTSGQHTYADPGTYTATVLTSFDGRSLFPLPGEPIPLFADPVPQIYVPLVSTITVTGKPAAVPVPHAIITATSPPTAYGDYLNAPLAMLQDVSTAPDAPKPYAVVDYGSGAGTRGMSVDPVGTDQFNLNATNDFSWQSSSNLRTTFAGTLHATITFKLNDHINHADDTVLGSITQTINAVPNSQGGVTLNLTTGQAFSGSIGVITFTDVQGGPLIGGQVDWGDNSAGDTAVTLTPLGSGMYQINDSYTYAKPGRYRISFAPIYKDVNGYTATDEGPGWLVSTAVVTG